MKRLVLFHSGHIDHDLFRNAVGKALDFQFLDELIEGPSLILHADRDPLQDQFNLHLELFIQGDLGEIDVEDLVPEMVPLDLLDEGLAGAFQRDDPSPLVQDSLEIVVGNGEVDRLVALVADGRGDQSRLPHPLGGARSELGPFRGFQVHFIRHIFLL